MVSLKTTEWEIKNIDTILFDKDGTFIDLHYFWGKMTELRAIEVIDFFNLKKEFFENLCFSLGYDVKNRKMLKDGITAMYSRPQIIEIFAGDINKLGAKASHEQLEIIFDKVSKNFYKDMQKYTKPIPEAIDFIKKAKLNGLKTGIVTSDSIESTLLTIKQFNWESLFDIAIGRENTKENKESGVPVKLALEKLNSTPNTSVMVGDAPMDYIAAKNAGVNNTILVSTGQIDKETLANTSKFVVNTLKDINLLY